MSLTLANMTPAERAECVGMWCEDRYSELVILAHVGGKDTLAVFPEGGWREDKLTELTPRFDLPRAWTPSGEPVPGEWVESPSSEHHRRWCARWEKKPDEVTP